eukprot:TRINITY_DN770_c0_g1_i1.p1 TRINITY_DN770_c0_g1~~TRINITY_DN770_c0_g1_i1.p1  ORF type:complete len:111 (+),score=18.60 TRINITY_DN770_c0_g1_i1:695-1027(+)
MAQKVFFFNIYAFYMPLPPNLPNNTTLAMRDSTTSQISSLLRFQPYSRGRKANLKLDVPLLTNGESSSSSSSSSKRNSQIPPPTSPTDADLMEDWEGIYVLQTLKSGNST